jgi:hypothetical protein
MSALTEALEALSADVRAVLTRLDAFVSTGKPAADVGAVGSVAIDYDARIGYGPKAASGLDPWGAGWPFAEGPQGLSAKQVVIAAGALPAGASDADFAEWLANAQVASVTPLIEDAEAAAVVASTSAATATTAADTASAAAGAAAAAAATATTQAGTAATAAVTAVDAADGADAARVAAEAARDEAQAIAGGDFQPLDADLTAIAALDAMSGLIEKTGAGAFTRRAVGVATGSSVPDRAAADARYVRTVGGVGPDSAGDVPATSAVTSVGGLSGAVSATALSAALGLPAVEVQQGFALADLRNALQPLSRGVADSFADGTGISSLGAFRRVLRNLTNTAVLATPTMTGSTTSGWTAGSNDNNFRPAWRAFDKSGATEYRPNSALSTGDVKTIVLTAPGSVRVSSYQITSLTANGAPTAWMLEGSNDGTAWTAVDSRTGVTAWTANQARSFAIVDPVFWTQLRWTFSAVQSSVTLEVAEIALTGDGPTATSGSVQSVSFAAGAVPIQGLLTVSARRLDGALNINTDLIGWISRNGGANWTQVVLAPTVTVGGFTTYEGVAGLSDQPSASSVRWKLDVSSAPIEVAGVALQWA